MPQRMHYDSVEGTLSVDIVLLNTSTYVPDRDGKIRFDAAERAHVPQTLHGPLLLKVTDISSDLGMLTLIGTDGLGVIDATAIDMTDLMPNEGLRPGQKSGIRHLKFALTLGKPPANPDVAHVLNLHAEAFAQRD